MKSMRMIAGGFALIATLSLAMGCGQAGKKDDGKDPKVEHNPDHGPGPHGGAIGDWGGGKYHFEFKPNHVTKEATVWILGEDEKTPIPIKAKDGQLTASVTGMKTKDTFEMVLKADRQEGDPEGKASRFVGKHVKIGIEQEFKGVVAGEADGTPYFGDFEEKPEAPKK